MKKRAKKSEEQSETVKN